MLRCILVAKKKEYDRYFDRLDRPVEESRPDRFPFLLSIVGLCSGKWQAIKAVPCGCRTPARVRFVTSPFHCLHELDQQMQPS